jgi:hypothetical protein
VLRIFFHTDFPDGIDLPAYFWNRNCEYDDAANCYKFKIPLLHNPSVIEEVYIPREHVLGVSVRYGAVPDDEVRKIGFQVA